ncbi:hypothetical protein PENSUB_9615 [Penicillium subrubescens]|uniref:Uncharacterized protein n=1 Tax=Penicillium subrubescens TaxID=1316194 RepID=A0A1Q5TCT3_9EURO|nr:hypothetical protein PENSUB_9615 [Penicillium subrubescens]
MDHVEFMKAHELIPPGAPINTGLVEPKEWEGTGLFVKPDSSMYFRDCGNTVPRE